MKKRRLLLIWMLLISMCFSQIMPMTVEAAKKKPTVKSVELKVNGKKVNSKTITVKKGSSLKVSVKVKPSKAKKSVTYKTSNKKVATVSKGKIKAKKIGTSKITVSVKSKGGKKSKNVWFKVKVVKTLPKTKPGKPSTPTQPTQPSKPNPTPENPKEEEPNKPSDDWKNCSHVWGNGLKGSEWTPGSAYEDQREICNGCIKDVKDIYEHQDLAYDLGNTKCDGTEGWSGRLVRFYVCKDCGACKKVIPEWSDNGRTEIFENLALAQEHVPN